MKHCEGCPILIHTEKGENVSNYGCLPCFSDVLKWYQDTNKIWACHETGNTPCIGFLKSAKNKGIKISVNKQTIFINEQSSLDEIYK